jgi:hypothetical protein
VNRLGRLIAAITLAPGIAGAQAVIGPWDDATIVPPGMIRLGIGVHFGAWNERFDDAGQRVSLGAPLSFQDLGPGLLPGIGTLPADLGVLTGIADPGLSLGSLRTRVNVTGVRTPITIEYGLATQIGLHVVIPYVKNRVHVSAAPNTAPTTPTIGLNPAWSFPGARSRNATVVSELVSAATTLDGELARCAGSTDPTCALVNADRTAAMALVSRATTTATALASVYGTTAVPGSAYAPLAGSGLSQSVDANLAALGTDLATFLGPAPAGSWVPTRPVPAAPLAAADLDALLGDPVYGIGARVLSDYEHSHVGDIEVGARLLLVDTFGPRATTAALPRAGAIRLTVGGTLRLPTGQLDLPNDFTDVGTGDRQADLEVSGHGDLAFGTRLWTSAVLRIGIQRPDRLVRRVPAGATDPFPEVVSELEVARDLGDYIEAEVAPRYVPNDAFALSALYRYRSKGADAYRGTFDVTRVDGTPVRLDAAVLGTGTEQTEHLLGLAITLSTVRGYALREARWPLEVSLVHTRVLSGRGIPRIATTGIGIRLYRPVLGNPLRTAAGR